MQPTLDEALAARAKKVGSQFASIDDQFAQMLSKAVTHHVMDDRLEVTGALNPTERDLVIKEAPLAVPRLSSAIEGGMSELRTTLATLDPIATLVRVSWTNLLGIGDYFEPSHEGSEARIEVLAGVLLTSDGFHSNAAAVPDPMAVQSVFDLLERIDLLTRLLVLARNISPGDERATLRVWSQLRWLTIRGSSYAQHGVELARTVLEPLHDDLMSCLGFSIDDVILLADTTMDLTEKKVDDLLARARAEAEELVDAVDSGREREPTMRSVLETSGPSELYGRAALARIEYEVSSALTVTTDEIIAAAPALADKLDVLDVLVGELGRLPADAYRTPFDLNPLRSTPIVRWRDRIMLPVPGLLVRDYLGVLEPMLKDRVPAYDPRRATALEQIALQLVSTALPGCTAMSNLYYWVAGRDGRLERTELDGLVLFDRFAIVLEAKSSPLSVQASRGDVERLKRDLQRSIQRAGRQAARAVASITGAESLTFETEAGEQVLTVERADIDHVFAIAPSLHEMGGYAVAPQMLRTLGLFTEFEPPWCVFVNDLRLVVDMCRNPAEFLHYMIWRSRLPLGERVIAMDELDVFGSFLLGESAFDRLDEEPDLVINLASYTTDHDAYYMWRPESEPRPPKPRKFSLPMVDRFVKEMVRERPLRWLASAGAALDLTIENLAALDALRKPLLAAIEPHETRVEPIGTVALVGLGHRLDAASVLDRLTQTMGDARRVVALQRRDKKPRIVAVRTIP